MTEGELRRLTFGYRAARAVMAGTALGVFDALRETPLPAPDLAARCGLDADAAAVLLEALAALGVLERSGERYANASAAERTLVSGAERSRRHVVLHDRWHWALWARLEEALRSGQPVRDRAGDPFLSDPTVLAALLPNLAAAMVETSRTESAGLAASLRLRGDERLLDLGGGVGQFSLEIVRRWPGVRAQVLDLPPVTDAARKWLLEQGAGDSIETRAANFLSDPLDPEGRGFDLVLVSRVVMGLSDEAARALLERVRGVLAPGGRLVLLEFGTGPGGVADPVSALLGLDMLLLTGGRVRPLEPLLDLVRRAGYAAPEAQRLGRRAVLVQAGRGEGAP